MKKSLLVLVAVAISLLANPAFAEEKPFSVGVFDPVQVAKNNQGIKGARLSLFYGNNTTLKGFDFVLIGLNRLQSDMTGVQLGAVNWTQGGNQTGAQLGLVSITGGYMKGAQLGWAYNHAKEVTGLQFGIVNYAEKLNKGLQIGLVNIAKNGFLPVFVLFNFNFD